MTYVFSPLFYKDWNSQNTSFSKQNYDIIFMSYIYDIDIYREIYIHRYIYIYMDIYIYIYVILILTKCHNLRQMYTAFLYNESVWEKITL